MKLWQKITGIVILVFLSYTAFSVWIDGMVDMKYIVEPYDAKLPIDNFYSIVTRISVVLCVSILFNIILFVSLWRKRK